MRLRAFVASICGVVIGSGCSSSESSGQAPVDGGTQGCIPGQQVSCACQGGTTGIQACNADGASYGACICGSPNDAGLSDSGSADGAAETVTVAMSWVSFLQNTPNTLACTEKVTCDQSGTCPDYGQCRCTSPDSLTPNPVVEIHCCSDTAKLKSSDIALLVSDYSACTLTQTSPATYSLSCPRPVDPLLYFGDSTSSTKLRGDMKYVDGLCKWSPPYEQP